MSLILGLSGCSKLGKYVYIDNNDVLHVDRKCDRIKGGINRHDVDSIHWTRQATPEERYKHGIREVEIKECSFCIDDNTHEEIKDLRQSE